MTDPDGVARREALKRVAVSLRAGGLRFALAGGYAAWALGGPEPSNDVDFVVAEADAEDAMTALAEAGLEVRRPPEDWLFKVVSDGALVDVLFRIAGVPVGDAMLGRAVEQEVLSVSMPVVDATDLLVGKLAGAQRARLRPVQGAAHRPRPAREDRLGARRGRDGVERHRRGLPVPPAPDRGGP